MIPVIFIPSAPLLLPTLNPTPLPAHAALREDIALACSALHDSSRIIVLGGTGAGHRPDAPHPVPGLTPFPIDMPGCEARLAGVADADSPATLPISLTVGRWAAERIARPATSAPLPAKEVELQLMLVSGSPHEVSGAVAQDAESILAYRPGTAVIVVGDGTATRHEKAPGHTVPGAVELDDRIAAMLETGDLDGLSHLSEECDSLFALDGRCAWQAAVALLNQWGASLVTSELLSYTDPHHVAYFVARWQLEAPTGAR